MRWWGSNLGQVLVHPTLTCIVMYIYPASSATLFPNLSTSRGPPPTWESPISVPAYTASAWVYLTTLASPVSIPASPTPRLYVHVVTPVTYCVFLSPHCLLLSSRYISYKVVLSFVSSISWCYHMSLLRPPPSYPFSLAHTSIIGRRATHCATVSCLLPI